jgi:hypothetical protein
MRRLLFLAPIALAGASVAHAADAGAPDAAPAPATAVRRTDGRVLRLAERLPLAYEENRGQAPEGFDFLVRCRGYHAFVASDSVVFSFDGEGVRMSLDGAAPCAPETSGLELDGRANYLLGNDPDAWTRSVPTTRGAVYRDAAAGTTVRFTGRDRALEFVIDLAPRAAQPVLRFEGGRGPRVARDGTLRIELTHGEASISAPIAWQEAGGRRIPAAARWADAGGGAARIDVAVSDPSRGVRIDPMVTYASYLGGNGSEGYVWTAMDSSGAAYVYTSSYSTDFPTTTGAYSRTKKTDGTATPRTDLTVTKISASGGAIVYSTYIGGTSDDNAYGIFVDSSGRAVLTGITYTNDFPTTPGVYRASSQGGGGFVTQLNSSGTALVFSTFTQNGFSSSPAPAPSGGVYVIESFVGVGSYSSGGTSQVFYRRLQPTATTGGQGMSVWMLASDADGDAYVTGSSDMENFYATSGAYQTSYAGRKDAFVSKIDETGAIVYTTFLGGSQDETARDIGVNLAGQAFVLGSTRSTNFPVTTGAYRTTGIFPDDGSEDFLTRLNASGTALRSSSFLGVSGLTSIQVHGGSSCVVSGSTWGSTIQLSNPFQATFGGSTDAFLMKFNRDNTLAWSSYYGGSGQDAAYSLGMGLDGSVVAAGETTSSDYPTVSPLQQSISTPNDVMLVAVPDTLPTSIAPLAVSTNALPTWTVSYEYAAQTLTATGGIGPYKWTLASGSLPTGASISSAGVITGTLTQTGTYTFKVRVEDTCELLAEKQLSIRVNPPPSISPATMPPATINTPYERVVPVVDGSGTMSFQLVAGTEPPGTTLQSTGELVGTPSQTGVFPFTVKVTDGRGATGQRQISLQVNPPPVMAATVVPDWTEGRNYTVQFNASLGSGGFTWSVADGTVPAALDPLLGKISGPAGPAGTYEFTLNATDSAGAVASRSFTAKVNTPPFVASSLLPPAALGRPYAATLAVDGGTPPYRWSLSDGLLPEGLSLNGVAGVIHGDLAGPSAGPVAVECSDVTGALHVGTLTIPTAPLVDLEKKHWKETVTIPEGGPVPVLRYLELTAGALLRIDVKGGGQIDEGPSARLFDADGAEVDLAPWSRSSIKSLSVRGAVVPATGRYYLYVVPAPEATGKVKVSVSIAPRTSWASLAALDAVDVLEVPFSAPPGTRVSVSVKASKGSTALPHILGLLDADDADLLATGRIREKAGSASFSSGTPLLGGDYRLRISTRDGTSGAATYRITLKTPQKYGFELADVPSGN